jgi:glutathione S-transferase
MWDTCNHTGRMSTMIQIRHVPDELHRKLKSRAATAGMSLSDYLLAEIRRMAERPTLQEWLERVAKRKPADAVSMDEVVRSIRARREGL